MLILRLWVAVLCALPAVSAFAAIPAAITGADAASCSLASHLNWTPAGVSTTDAVCRYDTVAQHTPSDAEAPGATAQRAGRPVGHRQAVTPQVSPSSPAGVAAEDVGLSARGFRPAPGTRVRPDGVPENWRITGTDSRGGTQYSDPSNSGNSVRVMQGNTNSPYANSQTPYVRWQQDGQALDMFGNKLPSAKDSAAHVPLDDFNFIAELFQ